MRITVEKVCMAGCLFIILFLSSFVFIIYADWIREYKRRKQALKEGRL